MDSAMIGNHTTVYNCSLIELPKITVEQGSITAVNNTEEIPFDTKQVYYLYNVASGSEREAHGHKELQQLIIAAAGSFTVIVDDGRIKRSFFLSRPNVGLYMPPGLWRELGDFSGGSICLVLASLEYDENDYLRTKQNFTQLKNS
jgi:hypothetical protein